ncbi:hypothetical protein CP532_4219 [Ophiocordyceps camponoti-leonardi (nom. inval.)]|nr:hypothetical protein CP532_4219 [Ophiocordyceps camponoti-leonardi (nom. inval.)]
MPGRTKKAEETPSQDISMQDAPPSAQPQAVQDAEMGGGGDNDDDAEAGSEMDGEPEAQRVKILPGSTETGASFEFLDEGHTLGNALRYIIMKNPDVEFCAYAIPHPSEPKMNIRIQTYVEGTAVDALKKGLADLKDVCDVVADEFWSKRSAFNDDEAMT